MAINLAKMREKQEALLNKGKRNKEESAFWKPEEGEQDVRILCPSDGDPFKEFHFHYLERKGKKTTVLCPKRNYGEDCPICEFASMLWRDSVETSDDDGKKVAKGMFVKQRYFAPVIIRGEEEKGVRVWGFGKTAYEDLIGMVLNPEYGDITDIEEGTDLSLKYKKGNGRGEFAKTKLQARRNTSPLCDDSIGGPDRCAELLESIPDFDELFAKNRKSSSETQHALDEFLADENAGGDTVVKYDNSGETSSVDTAFKELMNA